MRTNVVIDDKLMADALKLLVRAASARRWSLVWRLCCRSGGKPRCVASKAKWTGRAT